MNWAGALLLLVISVIAICAAIRHSAQTLSGAEVDACLQSRYRAETEVPSPASTETRARRRQMVQEFCLMGLAPRERDLPRSEDESLTRLGKTSRP